MFMFFFNVLCIHDDVNITHLTGKRQNSYIYHQINVDQLLFKMTQKRKEEVICVEDVADSGVVTLVETVNNIASIESSNQTTPLKKLLVVLLISSFVLALLGCITDVELVKKFTDQSIVDADLSQLESQGIDGVL